jgi:DDE superfamily endonuclease/Tc5 transposase DNA-binding domain
MRNAYNSIIYSLLNMDRNSRIAEALADLNSQTRPNIAATARRHQVARETLSKRFRGATQTREDVTSYVHKQLTDTQEEALIEYINKLTNRGFPPTPQILKNIAESIAHKKLGRNWTARFCQRYRTRLTSIYLRTIDHKRKIADNSYHFEHFFTLLHEKIEKFNIQPQNIYNVDEKGFLLGFSRTSKRVVSLEQLKSKRIAGASQDGSREFITLIASICADGSYLPPALIYQGESYDLQDTWLDDFDHLKDRAFFACSKNGWSDDILGLNWLEQIFDRSTRDKITIRDRRLLIVDGHNSHVNVPFINYSDANRILLAVFPPHSTHRLQPLDIGLFSPLANYYSQAIDRLLSNSQGLIRLTKRDFWSMFSEAWRKAFHAENVRSAWETAGLYPLNPQKVIITTRQRESTPLEELPSSQVYKTPGSSRGLRRTWQRLEKEGKVHEDAVVLLHAGEKLAANLDIAKHEVTGLRNAVIHEKKKRKRGKALHLWEEGENQNQGRFFSPAKIARVRERIAIADEVQRQHRRTAADKKLQAAIARAEKAREKEEKKKERLLARENAREQVAQEKAERKAAREAQKIAKTTEAAIQKREVEERRAERMRAKALKETARELKKRSLEDQVVDRPPKRVRTHTSRTRTASKSHLISTTLEDEMVEGVATPNAEDEKDLNEVQRGRKSNMLVSQSGRFGRTVRLPTRFR